MTTRDHVTKWIVYALTLLPLCLADQFILGRIAPFGVAPLLYPLAAVAVGMMEGPFAGSLYGMGTGLAWWLGWGSSIAILLLTLTGLLAGAAAKKGLGVNLLNYALACLVLLTLGDGLRVLVYLLRDIASLPALLAVALPELLCSLIFSVPVYFLYRFVFRRVGGTALA